MVGGLTISGNMKRLTLSLLAASVISAPAAAQSGLPGLERPDCEDGVSVLTIPEGGGSPIYECQSIMDLFDVKPKADGDESSDADIEAEESAQAEIEIEAEAEVPKAPDYSALTPKAERDLRLSELFDKLKVDEDPVSADLIAEEIWAIWLDSGSDSVNFILRRGTAAQKRGELKLARRMFDNVTELEPNYAEGWARSARLALEEDDLGRALTEASRALIYEPRHFYALWTMGNVFEQVSQQDEALEAYREANKLYPELKAVKDRLKELQSDLEGDVL